MTRLVVTGMSALALFAAAGLASTASAHRPKCPEPGGAAAVGHPKRVYSTPHGCAFLRRANGTDYKPFASLVVRHEGRTRVLPFPWPSFSKVVEGTCVGAPEWFLVSWPYVTYSIAVCDASGSPVRLSSLGWTNRATGMFRVTTKSGVPQRLTAVAIPPNWSEGTHP